MYLARIMGTVVATRKDERLEGCKLLLVQPLDPAGKDTGQPVVAVDTVSAGYTETVLVVTGSTAAAWLGGGKIPIDALIIGSLDQPSNAKKK